MPGKVYAPGELDVRLATSVAWRNTDSSTHTVTADEGSFDSGYRRPGQESTRTFPQAGKFAYQLDDGSRRCDPCEEPAIVPAHVRAVVRGGGGWSDGVSPVLVLRPRS
jgi:hypothetical protein